MNAILQKRQLNEAFKRFQRLPGLPVVLGSDLPESPDGQEPRPKQRAMDTHQADQEALEEVFAS